MRQTVSSSYLFDVRTADGKQKVWRCYADSTAEAEETAKTLCRMLNAVYLGNLTSDRKCAV